ncbi:MAG: bifunctional nuclease family protein [Chloroflexi bacterium]|nr:bifunctional nuclease family protein [Chloroflexota bacterium]MCY3639354.1 bifunctional nuclease family protein [Chloroflexota bacterium]MYC08441.1 bifunctional nuclease family protein [Chloroflexota bacterium]
MLELVIDGIRVSLMNQQRVVILRVKDTDKYLPIWIGPSEADAIALKLQNVTVPRPLTHDLLFDVITSLNAQVDRIVVSDLTDDTFFAKIVLQVNGSVMEVDSRPSDALALAVRTDSPIFAETAVVDKAAIILDAETGKAVHASEHELDAPRPVTEEERAKLSAFEDFIGSLDIDLDQGDAPTQNR